MSSYFTWDFWGIELSIISGFVHKIISIFSCIINNFDYRPHMKPVVHLLLPITDSQSIVRSSGMIFVRWNWTSIDKLHQLKFARFPKELPNLSGCKVSIYASTFHQDYIDISSWRDHHQIIWFCQDAAFMEVTLLDLSDFMK